MMNLRTSLAVLAFSFSALSHAQVDAARVIASVNGEQVKGSEYYRRMEFLTGVGRVVGDRFVEMSPGFLTLETLITEKLLGQMAKEKGIAPTEVELNSEMSLRLQLDPTMLEKWKTSGRTDAELRDQVRVQLTQFKLQTFGVTITDQEVEKQYNENKPKYTTPKRLRLRLVAAPDAATRDLADKDLKAGKPFAEVASKYSVDITRAAGGAYGVMPVTLFSPAFRPAVEPLKAGQSTEWIAAGTTFVKFLVEEVLPEELQPLSPNLRRQIRREMMLLRGQVKNNLTLDMRVLRQKAKVDITEPEFAAAYKKFLENVPVVEPGKTGG